MTRPYFLIPPHSPPPFPPPPQHVTHQEDGVSPRQVSERLLHLGVIDTRELVDATVNQKTFEAADAAFHHPAQLLRVAWDEETMLIKCPCLRGKVRIVAPGKGRGEDE